MAITRRRFIQGVGLGTAALALGCGTKAAPGGASSAGPRLLVVVDIDGGNDWLNMMPPTTGQDRSVYEAKRPTLAVPVSATKDLGSGVGLHADFTGMADLHAAGKVAWITGVGIPNPNLSHFVSIDQWGQGSATPNGTGWLGRFADAAFDASDVLRGLTVTPDLPVMLHGADRSFVSITGASGYVYPAYLRATTVGSPYSSALLLSGFDAAAQAPSTDPAAAPGEAAAAASAALFLQAEQSFGTNGALPARTPTVLYPGDTGYAGTKQDGSALSGVLSKQLQLIAQMIAAGLPTQVFFCRLTGWDTHANELRDHPDLMRTLGGALSAFHQDLASIPLSGGTAQDAMLVLAYSEFGRRVAENHGGTDHGTAGLSICLGNALKGGLYGAYPDLSDLDANGNMKLTTDFRSLYATVLERWLGQAATTTDALLGAHYPRLGFL